MFKQEHDKYTLVFDADETAVAVYVGDEIVYEAADEPGRMEWDGDEAREVAGASARVKAMRWIAAELRGEHNQQTTDADEGEGN